MIIAMQAAIINLKFKEIEEEGTVRDCSFFSVFSSDFELVTWFCFSFVLFCFISFFFVFFNVISVILVK